MTATTVEPLMTVEDMSAALGITRNTHDYLRSTAPHKLPPSIKVGRRVRYSPAAFRKWQEEQSGTGDL